MECWGKGEGSSGAGGRADSRAVFWSSLWEKRTPAGTWNHPGTKNACPKAWNWQEWGRHMLETHRDTDALSCKTVWGCLLPHSRLSPFPYTPNQLTQSFLLLNYWWGRSCYRPLQTSLIICALWPQGFLGASSFSRQSFRANWCLPAKHSEHSRLCVGGKLLSLVRCPLQGL